MNQCPRCSYSLEGLPDDHVCPECGLEYHGETTYIVFIHRSFDRLALISLSLMLVLGASLLHPAMQVSASFAIPLLVIVVSIALGIRHLLRLSCDHFGELVLDHNGIRVILPDSPIATVRWNDVNRARYNWLTGCLTILGMEGQVLVSVPVWRLGSRGVGEQCAVLVAAYLIDNQLREELADSDSE